ASFTASTKYMSAKLASEDAAQLGEVGRERRRRARVGVLEQERDVGVGLGLRLGDSLAHRVGRLGLDLRLEVVAEHAETAQVALVASETLVLPLLLDALEVDVRAGVVGGRVRRDPVGHRLDERRPVAGAGSLHRL